MNIEDAKRMFPDMPTISQQKKLSEGGVKDETLYLAISHNGNVTHVKNFYYGARYRYDFQDGSTVTISADEYLQGDKTIKFQTLLIMPLSQRRVAEFDSKSIQKHEKQIAISTVSLPADFNSLF